MEIEAFRAREYWTVKALLATPRGDTYEARLVMLDGRKLDKFDLADEAAAAAAVSAAAAAAQAYRLDFTSPAPPSSHADCRHSRAARE